MNRFLLYLHLLMLLFGPSLHAQGPTQEYNRSEVIERDLDYERWEQLTKDVQYELEKPKEKKEEPIEPDSSADRESISPPSWNLGEWSAPAKVILILFFAVLIGVIIYYVVQNQNKKIDKTPVATEEEIIEKIEQNIEQSDIDSYLSKAIADGNYSLAIRLYYLNILKSLTLAGIIKWKKDKTNRAYLYEIKDRQTKSDFRALTNIFERIWYGNVALEQQEFESLAPVFEIFSDKIKNGAK
jgi:hypothetical protein